MVADPAEVVAIRPARASDMPRIRDIEAAAGALFRDVDMELVASGELPSDDELAPFIAGDRAWVLTDDDDVPVAFILMGVVDGNAHIEQVSVDPRNAHRRLGQALIEHVASTAIERGHAALTLTTYVDVPWNGPYYLRLGFRAMADDSLTPGLVAIRRNEAALGLDAWPRICMRRALGANGRGEASRND
jgi:GNAT superfamily N-acetyltransferase